MSDKNWLTVDRLGLGKTLEGKPKGFVLLEAIQNAFDEQGVTTVKVDLNRIAGSPFVVLSVEDDAPDGWSDLSHAYTMFAESKKKGDPEKRGRFNVGEKMILALARRAKIVTTTGAVVFDDDGRRYTGERRGRGSIIEVELRMTNEEMEEALLVASTVLPPANIAFTVNGREFHTKGNNAAIASVEATLPTVISDSEGVLRPTERRTTVTIYKPDIRLGQCFIYEMGIPVVEIECQWNISVGQRVPLNVDRDNVTPAYRRRLLALVVNRMAPEIKDAAAPWVQEAIGSPEIGVDALSTVLDKRYGEKRVMYDPSDPEANKNAVAAGYTVVQGRSLGGEACEQVRRFRADGIELLKPAGQVTPSTKGTWEARIDANPDAPRMDPLTDEQMSEAQRKAVAFVKRVGAALLGFTFPVVIFPHYSMGVRMSASWSKGGFSSVLSRFSFYVPGMKGQWDDRKALLHLVIHECAHHYESDHLSERYYDALTDLGVKATTLALEAGGSRLFAL